MDWVIRKTLWELKESELGLRIEVLQRGRDSFFCAFFQLHQMLFVMLGADKE